MTKDTRPVHRTIALDSVNNVSSLRANLGGETLGKSFNQVASLRPTNLQDTSGTTTVPQNPTQPVTTQGVSQAQENTK